MTTHHQFFKDIIKFPNLLCIYRLVAIIVSVTFFVCGFPIIGSTLGLTAGLSDYWDGIYARKHNMVTRLGALLDGAADLMFNFFVISAAVYMGVWPLWALFLWGFRDLSVLTMRASAAQMGFDIHSSMLGKVASNFIFYGLFLMPIDYALNSPDYMYHQFVVDHIHPYVGIGLHYFAFWCGLIPGIVMQWISGFRYAKIYIQKYDEVHKREAEQNAKASDENESNSSQANAEEENSNP